MLVLLHWWEVAFNAGFLLCLLKYYCIVALREIFITVFWCCAFYFFRSALMPLAVLALQMCLLCYNIHFTSANEKIISCNVFKVVYDTCKCCAKSNNKDYNATVGSHTCLIFLSLWIDMFWNWLGTKRWCRWRWDIWNSHETRNLPHLFLHYLSTVELHIYHTIFMIIL